MDTIALPVVASSPSEKQVEKKLAPNPTGQGGFKDHPELINRDGRPPRGWTWKDLIEQAADEDVEFKNKLNVVTFKGKRKQAVIKKLYGLALSNEAFAISAIREIFDRMDGKVIQKLDHTTLGEKMEAPILYIPEEKHE